MVGCAEQRIRPYFAESDIRGYIWVGFLLQQELRLLPPLLRASLITAERFYHPSKRVGSPLDLLPIQLTG